MLLLLFKWSLHAQIYPRPKRLRPRVMDTRRSSKSFKNLPPLGFNRADVSRPLKIDVTVNRVRRFATYKRACKSEALLKARLIFRYEGCFTTSGSLEYETERRRKSGEGRWKDFLTRHPFRPAGEKERVAAKKKCILKYHGCLSGIFIIGSYLCYRDLRWRKRRKRAVEKRGQGTCGAATATEVRLRLCISRASISLLLSFFHLFFFLSDVSAIDKFNKSLSDSRVKGAAPTYRRLRNHELTLRLPARGTRDVAGMVFFRKRSANSCNKRVDPRAGVSDCLPMEFRGFVYTSLRQLMK